jgi:hypothetical protein
LAGEHENRTHLTVLTYGDSGFEGRDGHQLRNLSHEGTAASEIAAWKLNYQEIILETMRERNFFPHVGYRDAAEKKIRVFDK